MRDIQNVVQNSQSTQKIQNKLFNINSDWKNEKKKIQKNRISEERIKKSEIVKHRTKKMLTVTTEKPKQQQHNGNKGSQKDEVNDIHKENIVSKRKEIVQ